MVTFQSVAGQKRHTHLRVCGHIRSGGKLLPQEGAHIGDAFFLLVPPGAFQLKLLFILAQAVTLLPQFLIKELGLATVLIFDSGASSLIKLLLQFCQPLVDVGKRLAFFVSRTVSLFLCRVARKVPLSHHV